MDDRRKALERLAQFRAVEFGVAICEMRRFENLGEVALLTDLLGQVNDIQARIPAATDRELLDFGRVIEESTGHLRELLGNHHQGENMLERFQNKALKGAPENKRSVSELRKRKEELADEEGRLEKKLRDARGRSEAAVEELNRAETDFASGDIEFGPLKAARVAAADAVRAAHALDEEIQEHRKLVRRASELLADAESVAAAEAEILLGEQLREVLREEADALVGVMRAQTRKETILAEIAERCPKLNIGFAYLHTPEFSVSKRGKFTLWLRDLAAKLPGCVRGEAFTIIESVTAQEKLEAERNGRRIAEANARAEANRRAHEAMQRGTVSIRAEREFAERFLSGPIQRVG